MSYEPTPPPLPGAQAPVAWPAFAAVASRGPDEEAIPIGEPDDGDYDDDDDEDEDDDEDDEDPINVG